MSDDETQQSAKIVIGRKEMTLNRVLILDTETTGWEEDAVCIEVAVALYSVKHGAVIETYSSLIRHNANPAEAINGIPVDILLTAPECDWVWKKVRALVYEVDAIVAHNAAFDRRFVPMTVTCYTPWICSCDDLIWPKAPKPGMNLVGLALAHGLGVAHAHRAAADVELLCRLLTRVRETVGSLEPFLRYGLRPKALFQALVPKPGAEAKAAGFRFDWDTRQWLRTMAVEDAAKLPFKTQEVTREGVKRALCKKHEHSATVTVRCPVCKASRNIKPYEFAADDFPLCEKDGSPMLPVKAASAPNA